ncbi:MAG: bifunctional proline dehydrogenase/L-glutamate gamma-semialdehyde dehydrogenase PutA [Pseudomonadota bacterium]
MTQAAIALTLPSLSEARDRIRKRVFTPEAELVRRLIHQVRLDETARRGIAGEAARLVTAVRQQSSPTLMESFLAEYGLSTEEGVGLMCLAEALLRVPDAQTIDELIADKIEPSDWGAHLGKSTSSLVNAATWGLMLTGKVLDDNPSLPAAALRSMVRRLGEPVVRTAVGQAMKLMGRQFVLGQTMETAMERAAGMEAKGYTYSYDMLGEAARTDADALQYCEAYAKAIAAIAKRATGDIRTSPGISVKLSALHPRYEWTHRETVMAELLPRARDLARAAARAGIGFNIDAEEADRLDLSMDVIEALLVDPELEGWDGFGVVVQAYGRRAGPVIDWLYALSENLDRRIMVRLVKGAYWDTEIKRAQEMGLPSYPVFTRKASTDVSYLANARRLLDYRDRIFPQFATHNAHTVAAIHAMAGPGDDYEFQRLHGMGEALYEAFRAGSGALCRIYAPVGAHKDLLAYLVRRLLENGANSSFVNQIVNTAIPPEKVASDPLAELEALGEAVRNPTIPVPGDLFHPRQNARGWNVNEPASILGPLTAREAWKMAQWSAVPQVATSVAVELDVLEVRNPAQPDDKVGTVRHATEAEVAAALEAARDGFAEWSACSAAERGAILREAARLYERNVEEFMALATREAGKSLLDSIAEVREAVDFLRYYADQGDALPGPGRGMMVCISPWNFPLAIFTGQISACLAAGNAVIAKPAEQTPLIAARAVNLLHEAGVPRTALQFLPGDGASIGGALTRAPKIDGVCFTGSTEVAQIINRTLADHAGPGAVLIAETGGLNAMIADSTALTEQVVRDILISAFQSAGQRCSALRVLYVQEEAYARVKEMLLGAMACLKIGDPWDVATDVGPVIDVEARTEIANYLEMQENVLAPSAASGPRTGFYIPPSIVEVAGIEAVEREVFGPVLHLARYKAKDLDRVIGAINQRGYGLTCGVHSRIDDRVEHITSRLRVGNVYVNRNQIGAIVGSQPFGGEGLSGTGPKAGGPHYVRRLKAPQGTAGGDIHSAAPGGSLIAAEDIAAGLPGLSPAADPVGTLKAALSPSSGLVGTVFEAVANLPKAPQEMPGPTGESNLLSVAPRGLVFCLGAGPELALAQAVQALAAGNSVVAVTEGASPAFAPLQGSRLPLAVFDGQIAPEMLEAFEPLAMVAAHGPDSWLRALKKALSARIGPILPLEIAPLAPERYMLERHLCIDTTAAGGNASLLAASA